MDEAAYFEQFGGELPDEDGSWIIRTDEDMARFWAYIEHQSLERIQRDRREQQRQKEASEKPAE